jgi:hypothetical protein
LADEADSTEGAATPLDLVGSKTYNEAVRMVHAWDDSDESASALVDALILHFFGKVEDRLDRQSGAPKT